MPVVKNTLKCPLFSGKIVFQAGEAKEVEDLGRHKAEIDLGDLVVMNAEDKEVRHESGDQAVKPPADDGKSFDDIVEEGAKVKEDAQDGKQVRHEDGDLSLAGKIKQKVLNAVSNDDPKRPRDNLLSDQDAVNKVVSDNPEDQAPWNK